jgi:hypothetical protein
MPDVNKLVANQFYNSALLTLLEKGIKTFDTKFSDRGAKKRILGGTYREYSWSATLVDNNIEDFEYRVSNRYGKRSQVSG